MATTIDTEPVELDPAPAPPTRPRRDVALIVVLVLAGVLRFGFGLWALHDEPASLEEMGSRPFAGDQYSYWYYGNQIADGDGYLSYLVVKPAGGIEPVDDGSAQSVAVDRKATSYYPVGYPLTLAAVFFVQDHTPIPDDQPIAVALLHAAMATASVWFVWLIARAALSRRRALVAAAITALFPNLILNVATYTIETAFIFWALAALAVILTHDWSTGPPSTKRLLAFGTVLGLSAVTRPFALPFIVGIAVALVVVHAGWKRVVQAMGLVVAPVVLLMVPMTIRNLGAMHAFVPVSTNLGDTACLDRSMDADGGFRWAVPPQCAEASLPEAERNQKSIGLAVSFILEHPAKELELMGKRFGRMLEHDHSGLAETETVNGTLFSDAVHTGIAWIADWFFWLTSGAAALGLVGLFRRGDRRPERIQVGIALIFLLLIPVELWGNVRFHIPALPFLAIAAAAVPLPILHRGDTAGVHGEHPA